MSIIKRIATMPIVHQKQEKPFVKKHTMIIIIPPTINEIPIKLATENNVDTKEIKSLFSNMSEEETFSTYHVYIMREDDTVESIMTKYSINKEILSQYNDVENIKLGDKIIIPALLNDK